MSTGSVKRCVHRTPSSISWERRVAGGNVAINSIHIRSVQQPMIALHQGRWGGVLETTVVAIEADGMVGYGSARAHAGTSGRPLGEYVSTALAPRLINRDPLERERLWKEMWSFDSGNYVPIFAMSAVDVALWDLAGKLLNVPVYKLIGGYRNRVPAYASSAFLSSIDDYLADAERAYLHDYRAYKIHAFRDAARDIELCEALHEQWGAKMELMLDASKAYQRREALQVGRVLERLGFRWYEEPLQHYDLDGYRDLRAALDIPVIGAETVSGGPYLLSSYLRADAFDMLQADVYWKGGITGTLKVAHMAEAHGMPLTLHHAGSPIMNWANLHVLGATSNTDFLEVLVPEDLSNTGLLHYPSVERHGFVSLPARAGLGFDIDTHFMEKNTTWSQTVR